MSSLEVLGTVRGGLKKLCGVVSEDHSSFRSPLVSLSPCGDFLVVVDGGGRELQFFSGKWDGGRGQFSFAEVWRGRINPEDGSERITCLLCLPQAGAAQKSSSLEYGGPDWTCVLVGSSTGVLRMFTDTGVLFLTQTFCRGEAILSIKPSAAVNTGPSRGDGDCLLLVHPTTLLTLDTFALYQTLRACRNQSARAVARGENSMQHNLGSLLAYQVLAFPYPVTDAEVIGSIPASSFDKLKRVSLTSSFGSPGSLSSALPPSTLILAPSHHPFLSGFLAVEASGHILTPGVIASKVKSALTSMATSLFSFGGRNSPSPVSTEGSTEPQFIRPPPLPVVFAFPDALRLGSTVLASPGDRRFAAVTDSLARVVLVDNNRGLIVRVWKGARDAELAWFETSDAGRHALFLLIHAPRRGVLEVFPVPQGRRVAAFNVPKGSKLISLSHGIMSVTAPLLRRQPSGHAPLKRAMSAAPPVASAQMVPCALVTPEGMVQYPKLSFHLALVDDDSAEAHDSQLLKHLKQTLGVSSGKRKSGTHLQLNAQAMAEIHSALKSLRGIQGKEALLEILLEKPAVVECEDARKILSLAQELEGQGTLGKYLHRYDQVLDLYEVLLQWKPPVRRAEEMEDVKERLMEALHLEAVEVEAACRLLSLQESPDEGRKRTVAFDVDVPGSQAAGVSPSALSLMMRWLRHGRRSTTHEEEELEVEEKVLDDPDNEPHVRVLGNALFAALMEEAVTVSDWVEAIRGKVSSNTLFLLTVKYFLASHLTRPSDLIRWATVFQAVWSHADNGKRVELSTRKKLESELFATTASVSAYGIALCCFGVVTQSEPPQEDSPTDWYNIPDEGWRYLIQIQLFEGLALLSTLFNYHRSGGSRTSSSNSTTLKVSLNELRHKGRGSVADSVAQWIVANDVPPNELAEVVAQRDTGSQKKWHWQKLLTAVLQHYSLSLRPDLLFLSCGWEWGLVWLKNLDAHWRLRFMLQCLSRVESSHLRLGGCALFWTLHLGKQFSSMARLIDKVGKIPKERLCKKDLGLSTESVAPVLDLIQELLVLMFEASSLSGTESFPTYTHEIHLLVADYPHPLWKMALEQPKCNPEMLRLQGTLSTILSSIADLNVRGVRPLNLFGEHSRRYLFQPLNSEFMPEERESDDVRRSKMTYLRAAISALVAGRAEEIGEAGWKEVEEWMKRLLGQAVEWELSVDPLRRHFVCELYARGLDIRAQEILPQVGDGVTLGSQLLVVAGKRMMGLVQNLDNDMGDTLARFPPSLLGWLRSLDLQEIATFSESTFERSIELTKTASRLVGPSEENLAQELLAAFFSLSSREGDNRSV